MLHTATTALLALLLVGAAWSDLRTRRIPNVLTVSGLALALVLRSFAGTSAVNEGLLGAGLALLVVLPLLALGGFGGGDAKLLIMVGAFTGPRDFVVAFALSALVGGALSLRVALQMGILMPLLANTGQLALNLATLGRKGRRQTLDTPGAVGVPYGVAIAAGTLIAWFLV
jgi:prepilin peptidase CpaA